MGKTQYQRLPNNIASSLPIIKKSTSDFRLCFSFSPRGWGHLEDIMATTSILTNKGASIIGKAITDEAKCVISRVVTSTHYENLPTELAAKSPFWWDGAEGTVTGLSLVNASLDVKVHWNARQDAQPVKSIGLMVKRAGAERDYLLYAESYSNTAVTLERALDRIFSLPINIPVATFDAIGNTLNNEVNEEIEEIGGDMSGLGASLAYDGENTLIQLKNSEGEVLSSIDASDFVIDGMVESVDVVDGYLVITFNTAAGKSDISIPVTDFFDASQYYTKTETNTQISSAITALNLGTASQKDVDSSITAQSDVNLPTSSAVKGYVGDEITALNLGAASQKAVDTSIGDASSSSLPTSDAVKAYVDAHSGGGGGVTLEFNNEDRILTLKDSNSVVLSTCKIPEKADVYEGLVLTATADNSSVKLVKNGTLDNTFEVNTGNGWEDYTFNTLIPLNNGDSCKWRCKTHPTTQGDSNYVYFVMTGAIEASGNCNSMLSSDFKNMTSLSGYKYAFRSLFQYCASLKQAPEVPATTLVQGCYCYMFFNCTSLTQAPNLPAKTLASTCYRDMFYGCSALTQAPELPATTLDQNCYYEMFKGCTALTQAPELSATTLSLACYYGMFQSCTSLMQAPELPATTLKQSCYSAMFQSCTSLTQAPELPATTLTQWGYSKMFNGCTSLNEIRIAATNISASNCLDNWLGNVAATGDFYCDSNTNFPTDSASGIPQNWTRHALSDYPNP
jgi:hypothetical protein